MTILEPCTLLNVAQTCSWMHRCVYDDIINKYSSYLDYNRSMSFSRLHNDALSSEDFDLDRYITPLQAAQLCGEGASGLSKYRVTCLPSMLQTVLYSRDEACALSKLQGKFKKTTEGQTEGCSD